MQFVLWILVGIIVMGSACTSRTGSNQLDSQVGSNEGRIETRKSTANVKPLEPLLQRPDTLKASKIESFGSADLRRHSTNKNDSGRMLPPYHSAEILASLNRLPQTGEKVTVIPLTDGIEPFLLPIASSEMKSGGCSEENNKEYWEIKFDSITSKNILDAAPIEGRSEEFPFDIIIIYPSLDFAKRIPPTEIKVSELPSGIATQVVHGAIDIDADGKPDLLEVRYCCRKSDRPAVECDLTCTKMFRRIAGKWNLIEENQPC